MYCDKREHLVGKIMLDIYKITKKVGENWLIKIYLCVNLLTDEEYIIKLVRILFNIINRKEDL